MTIPEANGAATGDYEPVPDQPIDGKKTTWAYGRMAVAASLAAILATSGLLYQTHTLDQRERHWRTEKTTFLDEIETLKGGVAQATNRADIMAGVRDQILNELGIARVQIMGLENQLLVRNREVEQITHMITRDQAAFVEAQGRIARLLEEREIDAAHVAAERRHLEQRWVASTEALQILDGKLATTRIALSNAHQEVDELKRELNASQASAQSAQTSLPWQEVISANLIRTED